MLSLSSRLWSLLAALGLAGVSLFGAESIERAIALTPPAGATAEDEEIRRGQTRAGAPGAGPEAWERLGWAYVAKARRTLDAGYWKLAETTAAAGLTEHAGAPALRLLRGHALHNLHRFAAAETIAAGLAGERGAPEDFALLSDVRLELGRTAEAIAALERFAAVRPGVEALSRIAQVRWLKGDLRGAIAALEEAVRAADPRAAETQAWLAARLSGLHLQAGDTGAALRLAERAKARLDDFAPARLALGRARLARGETEAALTELRRAAALNPLPEYRWWLADALRAAGRGDEAAAEEAAIGRRGAGDDPRTLALFLATRGTDATRAVALARAELRERGDVFTHDALAWALHAAGDTAGADAAMRTALREGTVDARLALHAGEIAAAAGRGAEAAEQFRRAEAAAGTLLPSERARLAAAKERVRAGAATTAAAR
jgi:tetratricopeptide (TPR) repeat protein